MNLSLRLLRAFVAVCQEGHVGRAAAKLYVSQPSLSQDIRRLEREIGVVLFDRGPRGLSLTAPGKELLRSVEAGLRIIDRGIADTQALAAGDQLTVRIAYSPSMSNKLMPTLLPLLEKQLVGLAIDEREVDTGEVGAGVLAGKFDIGFAHSPSPDAGLKLTHLVDEPLCVAVANGHRLAEAASVSLSELEDSALLIWPRDSAPEYYDEILGICEAAGLKLREVKEFRHITPRTYLLSDNHTFSLLPRSTASIQRPEVTFIELSDPGSTVPLMFIRRADDKREELKIVEDISRKASLSLAG